MFAAFIRDITARTHDEQELQMHRRHLAQLVAARTAELESSKQRLEQVEARLRSTNRSLARLARVDELTGIGNRRAFDERLAQEWRRCRRADMPWSLIMSDIDHFKRYNDAHGHAAGDRALIAVAGALRDTFQRATDFPARYGGEEFAVILSGCDARAAFDRAEILRLRVHDLGIEHAGLGGGRCLSLSMGIATWTPGTTLEAGAIVEAADQALYRAKAAGRDRIESAGSCAPGDDRVRLRQRLPADGEG